MQLVENIQRSNLKSLEIENALYIMVTRGDSQQDIVLLLNKSKSWVSDILKAHEIRSKIKADTSNVTSSALKYLRNIDEKTINKIIPEIIKNGGTVAAVKLASRQIEGNTPPVSIEADNNKKTVKAQNEATGEQDYLKVLFSHLDKMINSGHDKEQIIEKISDYLEYYK
jgi:hypothetical protein